MWTDRAAPGLTRLYMRIARPTRAAWGAAISLDRPTRAPVVTPVRGDHPVAAPWQLGTPLDARTVGTWQAPSRRDAPIAAPWGTYARLDTAASAAWGIAHHRDGRTAAPWGIYLRLDTAAGAAWGIATPRDARTAAIWGVYRSRDTAAAAEWGIATRRDVPHRAPWGRYARTLDTHTTAPTEEGVWTVVIPVRTEYRMINTFALARADTGAPITALTFSADIDADTWTWGWAASILASQLSAVRGPSIGDQVELIAELNGQQMHLVVESIVRERRFAAATLSIRGRGRAAWLAAPHSPTIHRANAESQTAAQLLDTALTANGIPLDWSVDWGLTDWLVPAGAWVFSGSYIEAAQRIAEAGGGYVQAHRHLQTLAIRPRYPTAPWTWDSVTPDLDLPEDVVEVEGIDWQDRTPHNAVYVIGGAAGGRRDRILRTGSAGDILAPDVVDPLATATEMTRQRGIAVLGSGGRKADITLRLPVLPETGIIEPGQMLRYTEGGVARIGITRAVSVQWDYPVAMQQVRIEHHEEPAE